MNNLTVSDYRRIHAQREDNDPGLYSINNITVVINGAKKIEPQFFTVLPPDAKIIKY